MIAYDLDGVLVADLDYAVLLTKYSAEEIAVIRSYMSPIFKPSVPYIIITGRPDFEFDSSYTWLCRYFSESEKPIEFFHFNPDWERAADYKIMVLNTHPMIDIFYESDETQVELIRKKLTTECRIIWWQNFLRNHNIMEI